MILCKNCRSELICDQDNKWIHKEDGSCVNAEPQKYCKGCNELQYSKNICDCGYEYEIRG